MNFFVTGVTGNVGSAVLRRLLRDDAARAWVLIRAPGDDELHQRLGKVFELWGLPAAEAEAIAERVQPVKGDMGLPRFGLSEADWGEIRSRCSHLVHAAGVVRMNLSLDEARKHAVGSAGNLIALAEEIAASGKMVNLAFVSTVGVAGKKAGALLDEWVTEPRQFHNTYEQAKAEAEDLLRAWKRRAEICLTVHRPSMVVGASDGDILRHQIFYFLCEFLSGRHTKGLQPTLGNACLDTVPVDYVADAVCWAVQHPETDGSIFNLCSGSDLEVPLSDVQKWTRLELNRKGVAIPRIRSLPARLFMLIVRLASIAAPVDVKKRLGTLPVLIDYLGSPQVFEGQRTRAYLKESAGLSLPAPEGYLPGIIRNYFN